MNSVNFLHQALLVFRGISVLKRVFLFWFLKMPNQCHSNLGDCQHRKSQKQVSTFIFPFQLKVGFLSPVNPAVFDHFCALGSQGKVCCIK